MERHPPPPTGEKVGRAVQPLISWQQGEITLPLLPVLSPESTHVRPKVRGETIDRMASFSDALASQFFKWWQEDQEGVMKALRQDAALRRSIDAASEIIAAMQTEELAGPLYPHALLERLAEIDLLATPHIPRFMHEDVDGIWQAQKERGPDSSIEGADPEERAKQSLFCRYARRS